MKMSNEVLLDIKEETFSFCELLLSLEDNFPSDLTEREKKADWSLAGGKLWRLSSFWDADDRHKFPRGKYCSLMTTFMILQRNEITFFGNVFRTLLLMLSALGLFLFFSELMT